MAEDEIAVTIDEADRDRRYFRKLAQKFAWERRKAEWFFEAEKALTENQRQRLQLDLEAIAKDAGWTLRESAAYIFDPFDSFQDGMKTEWHERLEVIEFIDAASRAIAVDDLEAYELQDEQLVRPKTLLKWAKDNGYEIPIELDQAVAQFGITAPREPHQSSSVQNVTPYPSPPDLTWEEITLNLRSDELIEIVIGEKRTKVTFSDMGFRNRTKGDVPDKIWGALCQLASRSGEILARDIKDEGFIKKFKPRARIIRRRLEAYFGLNDDPFHPYREPPQGYKTKFTILDARQNREVSDSPPSGGQQGEDWGKASPEEFLEAHPEFAPDQDDNDYR